jgi:hypothetical protein
MCIKIKYFCTVLLEIRWETKIYGWVWITKDWNFIAKFWVLKQDEEMGIGQMNRIGLTLVIERDGFVGILMASSEL